MDFPLEYCDARSLGFDVLSLNRMLALVQRHVDEGRYPGAQVAVARHGKLALFATFGQARLDPALVPAAAETLWLLYSNTKVLTAAAIWILAERGLIGYPDPVARHLPGFEKNGKGGISIAQLLTHQAGFPSAQVPKEAWTDHDLLRQVVCDFALEWEPGSRMVYHPLPAHWVAAAIIEAVAGRDFRHFIRDEVLEPIGLGAELFVGLPEPHQGRAADMHDPVDGADHVKRSDENTPEFRAAGVPGGGGYGTARAMAAFYQMMLAGGRLNGVRLISPRTVEYVTRNHTGDRIDEYMGMPMHRGIGPHSRGTTVAIRGLGSLASPRTFGHGGVGSSYCWADPESGVSFAYLTNARVPEPWHSYRLEAISNCVHAAIDPL